MRRRHPRPRTALFLASGVAALVVGRASPAAADNCSVFTDCFNQANSASEAAFGLLLLAGLSLVLDFLPVIGTAKSGIEAVTGRDLVTGEALADWERSLGLVPFLPVGLLRGAGHVDDLAGLARRAGDAGDAAASAGPAGRALPGRSLVDEYRDPATTSARRRQISERLGDEGGQRTLRDLTGNPGLMAFRPRSDADVPGWADMVDTGEAWPGSVQFGGSRATNIVYWDGETLYVIEAKGGSSSYGQRLSTAVEKGEVISQTHPRYPLDVANDMRNSSLADGRNEIGDAIDRAYEAERVKYVSVRTGGRDELLAGRPTTVVEHVFLEPE